MRIARATNSVMVTAIGPDAVREDVAEDDPSVARPGGSRRLDELLLAQREEDSSDDPRKARPEEECEDEPDFRGLRDRDRAELGVVLTEIGGGSQEDGQPRQGQDEVGEAHEQVVSV